MTLVIAAMPCMVVAFISPSLLVTTEPDSSMNRWLAGRLASAV